MVERKEDLGNAIAMNSMMFNGARLIGPQLQDNASTTGEGSASNQCNKLRFCNYFIVNDEN